ncbi:hypothetical protein [Paenibacillus medicaginis]|uniref:Uncharacterized protein n=1 Tax=Paenibacillus medicaginis TaxID=1470560 RepID=A0ABV5C830_9BACL
MEELMSACQKFLDGSYKIEDFTRFLSWVGVPSEFIEIVNETEQNLERIMVTEFEENWYQEGSKVVLELLKVIS